MSNGACLNPGVKPPPDVLDTRPRATSPIARRLRTRSTTARLALTAISLATLAPLAVVGQYHSAQLTPCSSSSSSDSLVFDRAIVQLVPGGGTADDSSSPMLHLDLFGTLSSQLDGYSNTTAKLATLFATTQDATSVVWRSTTYACDSLFPPSPLPYPYEPRSTNANGTSSWSTYCPLAAGSIGLNVSLPFKPSSYPLSTLETTVRLVDASTPPNEVACTQVLVTPYDPSSRLYALIIWLPVALAIGYWAATWAARFAAGWIVGRMSMGSTTRAEEGLAVGAGAADEEDVDGWGRRGGAGRRWGTMLISGLSGERVGVSGGLLRFITPGFRDVLWHLQFCAALAMVAVAWPPFAYPIFARTAWASLVWNTTIATTAEPWNLLTSNATPDDVPQGFRDQATDALYPLYLDRSLPNVFMNLGGTAPGLPSFAAAIGLRDVDLFPTCLALFLMIAAGIILLSGMIWVGHGALAWLTASSRHHPLQTSGGVDLQQLASNSRLKTSSSDTMDVLGAYADPKPSLAHQHTSSTFPSLASTPGASRSKRAWQRFKLKGPVGAFHWSALCGNLVRLLVLFHLPITIFSTYQWTQRGKGASTTTVALAALAFAAFSVVLPVYLLIRVSRTPTGKLYDATRTLLSLGPLYNLYAQGKQLYQVVRFVASLATGLAVGAGQGSGLAQAIVLLVVEISWGLVTTFWQPWRPGAGMAVPTFIFSVIRIVSVALLLILSPVIGVSTPAAAWIAYAILLLQALAFVCFLVMLLSKISEGLIRLFGNVKFHESTHPLDGGLLAALGGLNPRRRQRAKPSPRPQPSRSSTAGSINTQMLLDRYSQGDPPIDDPSSSVTRGFSVVRGGKAAYQDPYAALPLAEPLSAGSESSRPRHARTRSQTAIIETFPASTHNSPGATFAMLPTDARSGLPPLQIGALPNHFAGQGDDSEEDSPTYSYEDETPRTRVTKPSTWFNRKRNSRHADDDDDDDENAAEEITGAEVTRQASKRTTTSGETRPSFQVNRVSRHSTISGKSPRGSTHVSPTSRSIPLPDAEAAPTSSFVVQRPAAGASDGSQPSRSFVVNRGAPPQPVRFAPVRD